MPAQYVKPYVKRGKNDAADAEAICEAVTRPTMRFVPVKTPEQQSVMMLHRVRLLLNRQRTQLSNSIRAHLSEFGIVAPIGRRGLDQLLAIVADEEDARVPADARLCLQMLAAQLAVVKEQILENDRRVRASARATELGRRLMDVPGVGPLLASALTATISDPAAFKTGRDLAAWIGLVPKQNSSGGKRTALQYFKSGEPPSQANACGWGHGGDPLCRATWNAPALAHSADAAPLGKGGCGCAGQQNGARNLGAHDKW
jgi:transposase